MKTQNLQLTIAPNLGKAFLTAILLTRSSRRAEAAVQAAIQSWNPDDPREEPLICAAVQSALGVAADALAPEPEEFASAVSLVPDALRMVMVLPAQQRLCLVLRVLLGMPLHACARMLELNASDVDRLTCAATSALAGFSAVTGAA
jgi:DNA-directed RNA polymerase specialized sigma24 family protein